jgi:exodeoxyribonuclease V beta subunit
MSLKQKLALEASAGSGKTFALSIRYVSLLFLGAKPEAILTLTFTNKASTEMSERISSLLKNLSQKETELSEISKLTNLSKEELLKRQPEVYKRFLSSNINISTIDKFNTTILRSFSLYLSLMPDFQVGEGVDEYEELKRFIKEIKKEGLYRTLIDFSVEEQKRVQDIFSYLRVLSQKKNEFSSLEVKSYNFEESKRRAFRTYQLIKELFYSCETLSNRAKKSLEAEDVDELFSKSWLSRDSFEYWDFKKCYTPRADELLYELKKDLKEYIRAKESFFKSKYFEIFKIYQNVKKALALKTNSLEFDDVTNFVYELLRGGEVDSDFLYFRLDSRFDHILIDEFQDTSITQFKILEPLIEEISSGVGVKEFKSFFYVGDTKQSIYRFRGGVKELFYYVKELFDVEIEKLNTNYRSTKRVVEFVNSVFENKIKGYIHQKPNSLEERGYIKVVESEELLDMIVKEVGELLQNGVSEDDIAILTYANGDAFMIEEELLKEYPSLNITTTTTIKLINTQTVRAIIEFIKYLYFQERIYLLNFLAIVGKDLDTEVDKSRFDITKQLDELIKDIVREFDIFYYDENILKFIEIATKFRDIEEFVFNCEDIEEASPLKKQTGLKILTIHKSKGLEFKHVIVCDRFKQKPPNRDHFIFDYDGVKLKEFYIRQKGRELVDSEYKDALDRQKIFEAEDELNTLYVAFTRAENSLIVCKKDKKSSFDILDLSPLEVGEIIKSESSSKEEIGEIERFEYESIRVGFQDKKSKESQEEKDIGAINFGLALHYMLENINSFSLKEIERAFWAMKNRYGLKLEDADVEKIKKRVENLLNHDKFLSLVDGKVYKEVPLSFNGEIKQVDLLIEKDDRYVVIDYKSSDSILTKHIKQVSYYKRALKEIFSKDVDAYLCYVRDEGVEIVEV